MIPCAEFGGRSGVCGAAAVCAAQCQERKEAEVMSLGELGVV